MKKSFGVVLTCLPITLFIANGFIQNVKPSNEVTVTDEIKDLNFTSEFSFNEKENIIIYTITNNLKDSLQYDFSYSIEKLTEEGTFVRTSLTDHLVYIEMMGVVLSKDSLVEAIDLSQLTEPYDKNSEYRIVKKYFNEKDTVNLYINFTTDKDGKIIETIPSTVLNER